MTTGIDVLDKTVQETNLWLIAIGERLGVPDRRHAYNALRAVLLAVRDRIGVDNAANLAAQLPLMIRGIYYDGFRPSALPTRERDKDAFLAHVDNAVFRGLGVAPERAVRIVLDVMAEHIDPREVMKIRNLFPEELRELLPDVSAKAAAVPRRRGEQPPGTPR